MRKVFDILRGGFSRLFRRLAGSSVAAKDGQQIAGAPVRVARRARANRYLRGCLQIYGAVALLDGGNAHQRRIARRRLAEHGLDLELLRAISVRVTKLAAV